MEAFFAAVVVAEEGVGAVCGYWVGDGGEAGVVATHYHSQA